MALGQTLSSVMAGIIFGLALAAPPGPMNAVIAEESVAGGWRSGFTAGLGAMTADACFLVLSLLGAVTVVQRAPLLRAALVGIGGLLLCVFAVDAVRDAKETYTGSGTDRSEGRGFLKAFALAITNPYQLLFWLTVGVGLLQPGTVDILAQTPYVGASLTGVLVVQTGSVALLVGLFGGIACWITGFPALLVAGRARIDSFAPAVATGSAVAFVVFGLLFLVDAVTTVL
jgi:threonine/homoserine/homoserine lactone efflux protein